MSNYDKGFKLEFIDEPSIVIPFEDYKQDNWKNEFLWDGITLKKLDDEVTDHYPDYKDSEFLRVAKVGLCK